jgi:hypothetical protein
MAKNIQLIFFFLLLSTKVCYAQLKSSDVIYRTIMEKDSLLFSLGFNNCDISQFENLMSDKLIFFHDKNGISNKQKFLSDLKMACARILRFDR